MLFWIIFVLDIRSTVWVSLIMWHLITFLTYFESWRDKTSNHLNMNVESNSRLYLRFAFVISSVIFLAVWRQTVVFKMISIFESYISLVEKIQIMDSILSNKTCKIDTEYIYPQTDSQTWESYWYMKWLGWKIM